MGLDPSNLNIDSALILGSAIFGVGWGLTGLCPAPAIVSLGASRSTASVFVPFMLAGMALKDLVMGGLTATCKIN